LVQGSPHPWRNQVILNLSPTEQHSPTAILMLLAVFLDKPSRVSMSRHQARQIQCVRAIPWVSLGWNQEQTLCREILFGITGLPPRRYPLDWHKWRTRNEKVSTHGSVAHGGVLRRPPPKGLHICRLPGYTKEDAVHSPCWVDPLRTRSVAPTRVPRRFRPPHSAPGLGSPRRDSAKPLHVKARGITGALFDPRKKRLAMSVGHLVRKVTVSGYAITAM
jgi:hypothetical protein